MKSISLAAVQSRKLMVDSLIELQTSNTQPPVSVEKMSLYTFTERQRERERECYLDILTQDIIVK